MTGGSPTLHRRRLGLALRDLRNRTGLTGAEVGNAVERSSSWISRVEAGRIGLRTRDLRELCELYGVTDASKVAELEALAREGRNRGWWSGHSDAIPEAYAMYIGLEDDATSLKIYSNTVVPGILQTEKYMRALYQVFRPPLDSRVIEARVQVRTQRQEILKRSDAPSVTAVIDQGVLHRQYGGKTALREQLQHLVTQATSGVATILVLPFTRAETTSLSHSFTFLRFKDGFEVVYLETHAQSGVPFYHEESDIRAYRALFESFEETAVDHSESIDMLREQIARLENA